MKLYTYKSGKLTPAFNGKEYETIDEAKKDMIFFFETRRGDQSSQFVLADDSKIFRTIQKENLWMI